MDGSILDQVINQFNGSISDIQSGSIGIAGGIFNAMAAMAIAILAFNHLMRKNVDMVDANLELIKMLLYLSFFYYWLFLRIYG